MKLIILLLLLGVSSLISANYAFGDLSDFLTESDYTTYNTQDFSITIPNSLEFNTDDSSGYSFTSDNVVIGILKVNEPIEDRDKFLDIYVDTFRDMCNSLTFEENQQECSYTLLDSYKTTINDQGILVIFDQMELKNSLESEKEDDTKKCYKYFVPDGTSHRVLVGCLMITDHMATNPFMGFGESIGLDIVRDALDSFTLENKLLMTFDELHDHNLKLADFIDLSKTPQYYIDRYNNESSYKDWFDRNYPGITINDAIGFPSTDTSQDILEEKGYLNQNLEQVSDDQKDESSLISDTTEK